ncbi:MAG TPA: RodZ domain-containing protein, partial [Terriglobales bacterium]|nr:RodZ domain-containing protein [Terriglobales bacterium]
TRFLRALEEERLDQLPGGVFNKGFIRAYARHLGLDENEIVGEYLAAVADKTAAALNPTPPAKPPQAVKAEAVKAQPAKPARAAVAEIQAADDEPVHHADLIPWGKLATGLLVVAFGFALWGSFSRQPWEPHKRRAEVAPQAAASKTPEPVAAASAPARPMSDSSPANSGQASPSGENASSETPSNSSATSSGIPSGASNNSTMPSQPAGALQIAHAAPDATAVPGAFTVLIEAREDSWVHITADGKEIMQDVLSAPRHKTVAAQKEVVVKAGNIGGLEFSFNGKRLPSQGEPDEVKTVTFGADGLQSPVSRKPLEAQTGKPQV